MLTIHLLLALLGSLLSAQACLDVQNVTASKACVDNMAALYEANSTALDDSYGALMTLLRRIAF